MCSYIKNDRTKVLFYPDDRYLLYRCKMTLIKGVAARVCLAVA